MRQMGTDETGSAGDKTFHKQTDWKIILQQRAA
jgi:hypothetical protein